MELTGFSFDYLFVMLFNLLILAAWPVFSLITLFYMRSSRLKGITQAIWVLIVLAIPLLGALAYWIIRPAGNDYE